ncbi:lipase family protein [Gordonia sp. SL306]|uniref:lipase family protein n=1 Tax=Gordonia sp. SL306 TaxID=2995145 RepID=UPI00226E6599|nr:lipase family protein [Gordonia sp. SL306]WAC56150.1 lipase [Gordonia sp. SL306]
MPNRISAPTGSHPRGPGQPIPRRSAFRSALPRMITSLMVATVIGGVAQAVPAHAAPAGSAPGTVFTNRDLPTKSLARGAGSGDSFTYWTTGTDRTPRLSTSIVQVPGGRAPKGGWPIVVWAHGSRGIADQCAPSNQPTKADRDEMGRWLDRGYAVVVPDYAGLGTRGTPEYFDTDTTASNIVDAVRASRDVASGLARRWAVVGEGQGAGAAIELARQATRIQGPTLDYRGSAASSIPVEFDTLIGSLGPSTTSMPTGVAADVLFTLSAIRNAQPSVRLDPYLTDAGVGWLDRAARVCADDLTREFAGQTLGSLFRTPLSENRELIEAVSRTHMIPIKGFTRPVMMTQSLFDQNVIVPLSLRYLNDARAADRRVTARTYLAVNQQQSDALSDNDIRWFVSRLANR